jgi:hypothetical protein
MQEVFNISGYKSHHKAQDLTSLQRKYKKARLLPITFGRLLSYLKSQEGSTKGGLVSRTALTYLLIYSAP